MLYPTELLGHISKLFNFPAQTDSNELPLRSRPLYPTELRGLILGQFYLILTSFDNLFKTQLTSWTFLSYTVLSRLSSENLFVLVLTSFKLSGFLAEKNCFNNIHSFVLIKKTTAGPHMTLRRLPKAQNL